MFVVVVYYTLRTKIVTGLDIQLHPASDTKCNGPTSQVTYSQSTTIWLHIRACDTEDVSIQCVLFMYNLHIKL